MEDRSDNRTAELAAIRIVLRASRLDLRYAPLHPEDRARLEQRCVELERRLSTAGRSWRPVGPGHTISGDLVPYRPPATRRAM